MTLSKIRNITTKSLSIFIAIILISSIAIPIFGYAKPVLAQTSSFNDTFTQDTSLNTNLWQINGPVGTAFNSVLGSPPGTLVNPTLTFSSTNGMGVGGVSGTYQTDTIQSVQSFQAPFTVQATVMGTEAVGDAFLLGITTSDASQGIDIAGNLNSGNSPYYGINYDEPSGGVWNTQGKLFSSPSLNTEYMLTISVSSSGLATVSASSNGQQLGTATYQAGTGPFYIIMAQHEGAPAIGPGPNQAYWQTISLSSSGSTSNCTTANSPTTDNSYIAGAESLTLNSGSCEYFFVGSTAGGFPMNQITWNQDLGVTAAYSGNLAISIGHQTSNTGSYNSAAGNHGIAGVGVSGFGSYTTFTAYTPNTDTLSTSFSTNSNDLVLILVGGEGDGNLILSGIQATQLQDNTYSEAGSNVIASEAIYEAQLPAGTYNINVQSITYPTNGGTSLGIVVYDFHTGGTGNTGTFPVTFNESGLPSGVSWSVTLGGNTQSSTSNNIIFNEPNGNYQFQVQPPSSYGIVPYSGSLTVNGNPISQPLTFVPPVQESGSTPVSLSLTGQVSGPLTNLQMDITSGTVTAGGTSYPVTDTSQYSSGVDVVGNSPNGVLSAGFIHLNNNLVLGLASCYQQTGPNQLSLNFYNGRPATCGGTTAITQPPSGSFYCPFNATGTLTISGSQATITASGTGNCSIPSTTYQVVFTESGLSNTQWSVTLNGQTLTSTSNNIIFNEPNGNYQFTVNSPNGWAALPASGTITVNNANTSKSVSFSTFQLKVSPQSQVIAMTGESRYGINIVPINGFDSPVTLNISGLPSGVTCTPCSFSNVPPYGMAYIRMETNDQAESGKYDLTLTATSGQITESQSLTLIVQKVTGVWNQISLTNLNINSGGPCALTELGKTCFSVQQNFYIANSDSSKSYWVQNVLVLATDSTGTYVAPGYLIFPVTWSNGIPTPGPIPSYGCALYFCNISYTKVNLPTTSGLTSLINGNILDLASEFGTFKVVLPAGSYYISNFTTFTNPKYGPQLDLVGSSASSNADFGYPTSGNVQSYIQLENAQGWSQSVYQDILAVSSTGETSSGLSWSASGSTATFSNSNAQDQGVAFSPYVNSQFSTTTVIDSGSAFVDQTPTTGINVNISDSTAVNGTSVTVTTMNFNNPDATTLASLSELSALSTGTLNIGSNTLFDVNINSQSSLGPNAIANVCYHPSSGSNIMEYYFEGSWEYASNIVSLSNTICGQIPVSALTGTPIVIGMSGSNRASFIETGLPSNTVWSVALNETTHSNTTNTINFANLSSGSYEWTASPVTISSGALTYQYLPIQSLGMMNIPSQTQQEITYNAEPIIKSFIASPSSQSISGSKVELNTAATDPDNDALWYRFSTDGGNNWSAWTNSNNFEWDVPRGYSSYHTLLGEVWDKINPPVESSSIPYTILVNGKVTGGGNIGNRTNFGFDVQLDIDKNGITTTGHLEYQDKDLKFNLRSNNMTLLFIPDQSNATFLGSGILDNATFLGSNELGNTTSFGPTKSNHNVLNVNFGISVTDSDKNGNHDALTITVIDSKGNLVYQKSGIVHGHIEIHKVDTNDKIHNDDHQNNDAH